MKNNLLPCLFTLGRLIILRVASLREERPELLRRVGWGCWQCVVWRTHQVHPHPRPRPRTRSSAQVSSAPPSTCRQVLTLCKKKSQLVTTRFVNCRVQHEFRGSKIQSPGGRFFCEGGSSLFYYSPLYPRPPLVIKWIAPPLQSKHAHFPTAAGGRALGAAGDAERGDGGTAHLSSNNILFLRTPEHRAAVARRSAGAERRAQLCHHTRPEHCLPHQARCRLWCRGGLSRV